MSVRAKTKVELRNGRDVFPPGTEVEVIEEADAAGGAGFFVEIRVIDGGNSIGVRYAGFVVRDEDLETI